MAINFHEIKGTVSKTHKIKSIISDHQSFSGFFYGIAEFIHTKIRNEIRIKNLIEKTRVLFNLKPSTNSIKFASILNPIVLFSLKPKDNIIKFKDNVKSRLIAIIRPDTSKVKIVNQMILKLNTLFNIKTKENVVKIKSSTPDVNLNLNARLKDNSVLIHNEDNIKPIVNINGSFNENHLFFENNPVDVSAWKMMRLMDMTGTLGSYAGLTLEETGRKKIE